MAEILSLHDAVKQFVNDGDTVALEGFTHLIPTAAVMNHSSGQERSDAGADDA